VTLRIECADGRDRDRAVSAARAAVRRGDLVIVPTETVYAVATDAFSERGINALRKAKGYDAEVPLPVMVGSRTTVAGIATGITEDARSLMDAFWPGPLTLMFSAQPTLAWALPPDAPLSVRMPLHPVALALLNATGPLAVTTANIPGLPAPTVVDDALSQLGRQTSVLLDAGDLTDDDSLPSTVIDVTGAVPLVVRIGALPVAALERICAVAVPDSLRPGA
jgi:tRNA threonylcarbamoyl adenosine modification protein (Sua5/YciO/YrdC/YwlC family)